jgi:hypothetical protein
MGLSGETFSERWPRSVRISKCRAYPLRTWELPKSANGSGSWPTPTVEGRNPELRPESIVDGRRYSANGENYSLTLPTAAIAWATATADDANNITRDSGTVASLARDSAEDVKSWATPAAQDEKNGMLPPSQMTRDTLPGNVAAWASPDGQAFNIGTTREAHAASVAKMRAKGYNGNGAGETLGIMANSFGRGPTPCPSEAPTARCDSSPAKRLKPGLNHRFGLWLMGYPAVWLDCVRSAMRGARKRPPSRSA